MKVASIVSGNGVEVMGAPEVKFKSVKEGTEWRKTGEQVERDGLRAWTLRVLVQKGEDVRVLEPVQIMVYASKTPQVADGDRVVCPDLDVRAFDGRLSFTTSQLHVNRDGKWVAAV